MSWHKHHLTSDAVRPEPIDMHTLDISSNNGGNWRLDHMSKTVPFRTSVLDYVRK